ncbi:hypothetical protein G6549_21610 [Bacillus sp. MM2020_1]|nr:hypothetical protein [Bacillus sp. MM2020_1]
MFAEQSKRKGKRTVGARLFLKKLASVQAINFNILQSIALFQLTDTDQVSVVGKTEALTMTIELNMLKSILTIFA